jgi:thioredoxin reductase (NADPH)
MIGRAMTGTAPQPPVLLIVDPDLHGRNAIQTALERRFGQDYQILTVASSESALAALADLATAQLDLALVAAPLDLDGQDGVDLLERVHAVQPRAVRALLLSMDHRGTRIPFGTLPAVQRATALGRIDLTLLKGWVTPEEWLYPAVQTALSAWTRGNRPHHEVVRVVGERWSAASHRLRDALTRNTVPIGFYAVDSDAGRHLVDTYNLDVERLPAVILHNGSVLYSPTVVEVAEAIGVHNTPSKDLYDVAIVGAGPAGLAAGVYGASEGLRTIVVESESIGGQAGSSSLIRNYLGFPRGLSGEELAFRAWEQMLLFGAQFAFTEPATGLSARDGERVIVLANGDELRARAVMIAAGVSYRRLGIPSLDRLIGAGVFYGTAGAEAPGMAGESVCVIGGANSAGQAALNLAKYAARVTLLVRGVSLEAGMSDYLITQLQSTPNVSVRTRTHVVDARGGQRLEGLVVEEVQTGAREDLEAAAVFVLIGAEPRTDWLHEVLERDDRGFILTGADLVSEQWPLDRRPFPFESSMPGVFAVGDVRHGSVKRVAGAVGEGSVAIGSVHQYLAELERATSGRSIGPT